MRSLILLLAIAGAVSAGSKYYQGTPPSELGGPDFELTPYCCTVVENVLVELKERIAKAGGNALKLKEILDHCIKKLLTIKSALVKQIDHFDYYIKKNGLPERIGAPGEKGDAGPKGQPGQEGLKGQKGEDGRKGLEGSQGPPGRMGRKGDVGETGPKGEKGVTGVQGHTIYVKGHQGPKGDKGISGVKGLQGPRGPLGEPGEKGNLGPKGIVGPQGWCLREKNKQCRPHNYDDGDNENYEPRPEPELIPNPGDFQEPDEKRIYYGAPADKPLIIDPEFCPSCNQDGKSDPEPEDDK